MAINAFGAHLRSRWFGMPFGDQGFLAPRTTFETLGGFDETVGRGEDHAFVWTARHAGVSGAGLPRCSSHRRPAAAAPIVPVT